MTEEDPIRWTMEWYSKNKLDGEQRHLMWRNCLPMLYFTRAECRAEINYQYGYIRDRKDLRSEPHGWRMPRPVRVRVVLEKV